MLTFFIGTYTEDIKPYSLGEGKGVYTIQFDQYTGELKVLHTEENVRNPSYLTVREDNSILYCITEVLKSEIPKVKAYKIKEDQSLEFLNEQLIEGSLPCHITKHQNNILVGCYGTGNLLQFPMTTSGELLEAKKNYQHQGSSVNKLRQDVPHAHQVAIHPNGKDVYVCDLGIDTIKAYHFDSNGFYPNKEKDCSVSTGGGPRHLVFNAKGNLAYVINELTARVSVLRNEKGFFQEINTYNSLPSNYKDLPSASAIRLHPNGQFLYVANRGCEVITVFSISEDKLERIEYQMTNGEELREFNITPDGKWLIACHQNSHDTVVYKIQENGTLKETYRTKEILSPVCIVFKNELSEHTMHMN